jgi:hypothetical protein
MDQRLTLKSLAPIQILFGEGKGSMSRPIPNTATAKKWHTRLSGRGFNLTRTILQSV